MYYFIVNPVSRSGHGMEVWKQTKRTLEEKGISYKVYFTDYCGHGKKLAGTVAAEAAGHTLVIIGGDGTVNEVLNGLPLDHLVTVAFIPVGSGNDLARGLKLPTTPEAAFDRILSNPIPTRIDMGTVKSDDKPTSRFAISSGLGYDAEICHEVAHTPVKKLLNRLHLGKLIYAYAAIKLLFTFQPADMDVELDGGRRYHFSKVYFITGMNLPYQGGGFRFCPDAIHHDGALDFIVIHGLSKLKVLLLFPTAYFAKHTLFRGITILRGTQMEIHSERPYRIHRDGEYAGTSDTVTFGVKKQILDFL